MLELTGLGSVLRGIGLLYWLLAFTAIALAIWKGRTPARKAIWASVWIAVFGAWPAKVAIDHAERKAYEREAWAYFKKKCETEAGEKIYKTFTGVKSVLIIKPLPPATEKDLSNQFWYGDPYSDATPWDKRGEHAAMTLTMPSRRSGGRQTGLEFVELKNESINRYTRINRPLANDKRAIREIIERPVSRFGVIWEDASSPEDRKYWVAASRLRVVDLKDSTIVAERTGFLIEAGFGSTAGQRRPWLTARGIGQNGRTCPPVNDYTDNWFIADVFALAREK